MKQLPTLWVITPKGLSCGVVVHKPDYGWRFISHVTSHRNSRRFWPTAQAAVPDWARRLGPALMTGEQFRAIRNGGTPS